MKISLTLGLSITRAQPQPGPTPEPLREVDMGAYLENAGHRPVGFHAPLHTEEDDE
ncbi:hypothetical protein NQ036_03740 [Brevibacterium sp. 91QC2O2]|uniref:hypothetical protein n=1 Tax=Brevibacterium TaxID=1696 RepID=UPI00211D1086|nr:MULTISPECIES: hypothetical protein [unclassified Brevibacterium]MCQ9367359.1 hypothetical protein [Brevibacterium sp. 91QC2O2]MCQ9384628.1 hypothetical protein [Brevibacterium sp. 68QC2CO]